MKNVITYLLLAVGLFFFSCKKETVDTHLKVSNNNSLLLVEEATWKGAFLPYTGLQDSRFIPDELFIKNGYARIYSDSMKANSYNFYTTMIRLVIPDSINIKGDSLNFEAGLKNPFNSSPFSPYYGRDITLYIKGETNTAFINNVATSDIDPNGHTRAAIRVGNTGKNDLPALQHNFQDYDTLILQTYNHGIIAYRNNAYLNGLAYWDEPHIGRLKEIRIIFRGSGFVNYVKIYYSVNGKLLMSENFNTDGQSTVIWH